MTIMDLVNLTNKYGECPKCGCNTIGNGTGTIEADTEIGYFKRTCQCGWSVEVKEGADNG